MKKLLILIVILAALFAVLWSRKGEENPPIVFNSTLMPLTFEYPDGYVVEEKNGAVIAMLEEDYLSILNGERAGGEGPPSITIQSFENAEGLSPQNWAEKNQQSSNYNLKMGSVSSKTVAGRPAITYRADGLYPNRNVVFANGSRIYYVNGSYFDQDSRLYRDFEPLVDSIELK